MEIQIFYLCSGGLSISSTSSTNSGALVSGLSEKEIEFLLQWVRGVSSGRSTCKSKKIGLFYTLIQNLLIVLAILDCRESLRLLESDISHAESELESQINPSEIIRSMLSLPEGFLCDGGANSPSPTSPRTVGVSDFLYDKIFSRPPMLVVREALALLAQKASGSVEGSEASLNLEQIQLAVKQLKLDALSPHPAGLT